MSSPGKPKVPPGQSARRTTDGNSSRGRMHAPAPNSNRMQSSTSTSSSGNSMGRNPGGSPPPSQRNAHQQGHQQQPRRGSGSHTERGNDGVGRGPPQGAARPRRHSQGSADSEMEEATRAALALAAVAQAASASNRSPAEAAEIAKLQATSIAKRHQARRTAAEGGGGGGGGGVQVRPEPRKVQSVNLVLVKSLLRSELAGAGGETSPMLERLADGENDAFLQQLLLFEYLRAEMDDGSDLGNSLSNLDDTKTEGKKTSYACDRVGLLLSKVELAYDSLSKMLPPIPDEHDSSSSLLDSDVEDMETPKIVPDLLPPCISRPGDATLEFFRACTGDLETTDEEEKDAPESIDGTTTMTDLDSNLDQSQKEDLDDEKNSSSMFSHMFNMKRPAFNKKAFASVFGKKRKGGKTQEEDEGHEENVVCANGEYTVLIEREMLGLTVENVLERTVVRTVLPGGPAKKAGAQVGSLIVKVGNIETKNLTHFETIDELRQSQRPLQLVLRQISDESLRSAREEMGRLIRGSGFGKVVDGEQAPPPIPETTDGTSRPAVASDRNIDFYTGIVRRRWVEAAIMGPRQKKDEPILRVAEKLVWILTLFVVGLERESQRLFALAEHSEEGEEKRNTHTQYHHTAKDYREAAKSVSKVLFDFVRKRMDPIEIQRAKAAANHVPGVHGGRGGQIMGRGGRGGRGRGRGGRGPQVAPVMNVEDTGDKLLLQIGDVLQRTRTFLADPTSPPAALLRGEVISCLCDILDADTDMKLADEESSSSTQGGSAAPITDLGSAGSLLKLIVLNCPIMRSPECESMSSHEHIDEEEMKRRFGEMHSISGTDMHRLHAGNRFLAVVHRLAASRSTSARITACSLGPVLWSHLDFPHQLQVRCHRTTALHVCGNRSSYSPSFVSS